MDELNDDQMRQLGFDVETAYNDWMETLKR